MLGQLIIPAPHAVLLSWQDPDDRKSHFVKESGDRIAGGGAVRLASQPVLLSEDLVERVTVINPLDVIINDNVAPFPRVMLGVLEQPFFKFEDTTVDLNELLKVEPALFDFLLVDVKAHDQRVVVEGHLAALLHEAVETPEYATSLKDKVLNDDEFAYNSSGDRDGRRAIDHACLECKHAMQSSLQFLERYQIHGPELHVSATAVVLEATDLAPTVRSDDGTVSTRVALKGMREVNQVVTELKGRNGLNRGYAHAAENIESQPRPQTIWGHGEERALPNMHVTAIKMNTLIQAAHTLAP